MRVLSLFDGISCGRLALRRAGLNVTEYIASEIDPYALKISKKNWPDIQHVGDVRELDGTQLGKIDLLLAGSPCFIAGSLVLTDRGYTPIENIVVGDKVLTHAGRFKRVVRVGGKRNQEIFKIKGMGNLGIYGTAGHPIYTRTRRREWVTETGRVERMFSDPTWTAIADLTPDEFMAIPPLKDAPSDADSDLFWYMIGRYTGDGWYRKTKRKHRANSFVYQFIICCGLHEFEELKAKFDAFGHPYNFSKERTGYKFRICSQQLVGFVEAIGKGAPNKVVHPDLFHKPDSNKRAYLQGMFDSDGSTKTCGTRKVQRLCTSSFNLALGVQLLVSTTLNRPTSLFMSKTKTGKCRIEGREVNCRDWYEVVFSPSKNKGLNK